MTTYKMTMICKVMSLFLQKSKLKSHHYLYSFFYNRHHAEQVDINLMKQVLGSELESLDKSILDNDKIVKQETDG